LLEAELGLKSLRSSGGGQDCEERVWRAGRSLWAGGLDEEGEKQQPIQHFLE